MGIDLLERIVRFGKTNANTALIISGILVICSDVMYNILFRSNFGVLDRTVLLFGICCIFFGILQKSWFERKDLRDIEEEARQERAAEKKREMEFAAKYPRINQIWGVRWLVRWGYKEGWWYSGTVIFIILTGFVLRMYKLGDFEFRGDEYQVVSTAVGYYHNGIFNTWDFVNNVLSTTPYGRAWPHTWLIAQSYRLFGISEWSSRIVSVFSGTFLIYIAYLLGKWYTNSKNIALMFSFTIAFSPFFIFLSRYARMYIVFIPVYLLSTYLIYRGLTERSNFNNLKLWVNFSTGYKRYFDFNYFYLGFGLITLYISYLLHLNTLIYGVPLIVFLGYMACLTRDKKYIFSFGILFFLVVLLSVMAYQPLFHTYFSKITNFVDIRWPPNILYWDDLLSNSSLPKLLSIVLLLFSLPIMIKKNKLAYLLLIMIFTTIVLVHFGNRYHSTVYISNIIPIAILLIITSLFHFCKKYKNKFVMILLIFFYVTCVSAQFYDSIDSLYGSDNTNSKYMTAYKTIIENSDDNQVILGQYLRTYYIGDAFKNKNITFVSMRSNEEFSYEEYQNTIHTFDSGWITWKTEKAYHIREDIREHIATNFVKYHGHGVDETHVEVYYFNKSMLK